MIDNSSTTIKEKIEDCERCGTYAEPTRKKDEIPQLHILPRYRK
jgi:hypothetical protein